MWSNIEPSKPVAAQSKSVSARWDKNCVFPNISRWMADNNATAKTLADEFGYHRTSISAYLAGTRDPSYIFILSILKLTGMTFEEAFRRKVE